MKAKLFLLFSLINLSLFSQQATWDYLVTPTATSPVSMTNAVVRGAGGDDVVFGFQWPFNFQIYNTSYSVQDSFYLSSNGYIRFDAVIPLSSRSTSIPTNNPAYGQFLSYGGNTDGYIDSLIISKVTGTAPNRIFTIEFKYYTHYIPVATTYHCDIQISFFEASKDIRVDYSNIIGSNYPANYLGINAGDSIFGTSIGHFPTTDTAYIYRQASSTVLPVSSFIANTDCSYNNILQWTKNNQNMDVVITLNPTNKFAQPVDGTTYQVGNQIPNGGGTVIYSGGNNSYIDSGIIPKKSYFYKIWSYNSNHIYSSPKVTYTDMQYFVVRHTVDSTSSYNIIRWDTAMHHNIDSVNIFRYTSGINTKIGQVSSAISEFIDYDAKPDSADYSYLINVKDSWGNFSLYSHIYKTIHLNVDTTAATYDSLYWTPYYGYNYVNSYYIYYGSTPGNMILFDSVPGNLHFFGTYLKANYYRVAAYAPSHQCYTNLSDSLSFSNIVPDTIISAPSGLSEKNTGQEFTISPNPSSGMTVIQLTAGFQGEMKLEVFNCIGEKVYLKSITVTQSQEKEIQLDLSDFTSGIYFVSLSHQGIKTLKKLIIVR